MIPSRTIEILGTSIQQANRFDGDAECIVPGRTLNELRALAMRLTFKFDDPGEQRDWQNRLNLMCDDARELTLAELARLQESFP